MLDRIKLTLEVFKKFGTGLTFALLILSTQTGVANATFFGSTLGYEYRYPTTDAPILESDSFVVGDGIEFDEINFGLADFLDVSASNIRIIWDTEELCISSWLVQWAPIL